MVYKPVSNREGISMRIASDASVCTGCRMCQLICSYSKTNEYNPRRGLVRIYTKKSGLISEPVVCGQCTNALCLKACLFGAIEKNKIGALAIDSSKCVGCGKCMQVCVYNVIVMHEKKAMKCDLCGGAPKCIEICPTNALWLEKRCQDG